MVSPYLNQEPLPRPPRPFEVMEDNGYIFVRRRDGKHYRPFEPMGVNPEEYRGKCEWLCDLLNDAHDFGAMEQIKRARAADRAATEAFTMRKLNEATIPPAPPATE